ncbi:MAG: ATP-binding protein [Clostridia bacterium]|nr:ATP-binding protein [Clostridia bacterium]
MILKRKIYSRLLSWKNECNGSRAILVEGARRIGKSTIVEEFAKNEYKSYLIVDFANVSNNVINAFEKYKSRLDDLFMVLSLEYNTKLYPRESVIVFDEVQKYPPARELIKYLVKDGRYDYIETGSLISIRENVQNIVIPSEERRLKMYPLDFEEFCAALGEEMIVEYIKRCFSERRPLEDSLHDRALLLFKQYMLVGGMPKSVIAYLSGGRDFQAADVEKRDILNLYRDDILKINTRYRSKVLAIFDQIPGFLSKHEKRVVLSSVAAGSAIDQYSDTFFWLGNSMICNECFLTRDPNVGLALNEERSFIKCYMSDTGLLLSHAFDENSLSDSELYRQIINGRLSINEGMLYENVIAQMLTANGHKLYFYTHYNEEKHRSDIEIDFIISDNNKMKYKIYPIEVKSSKHYTTASLERFKDKFSSRIGECYVLHPKNLKIENGITYLPAYMAICL